MKQTGPYDIDVVRAECVRALEPEQERAVLGDVVRRVAEQLCVLAERLTVR